MSKVRQLVMEFCLETTLTRSHVGRWYPNSLSGWRVSLLTVGVPTTGRRENTTTGRVAILYVPNDLLFRMIFRQNTTSVEQQQSPVVSASCSIESQRGVERNRTRGGAIPHLLGGTEEEDDDDEENDFSLCFVIKTENTFMCPSTDKLKFIRHDRSGVQLLQVSKSVRMRGHGRLFSVRTLEMFTETRRNLYFYAFYSRLKNDAFSDNDYARCKKA